MAVYTAADGKAQREHLLKFRNVADQAMLMVYLVTHEELLEALQRHMPTSVLFDGQEVPGVEMVELIKEALRLSTKHSPIRGIPDCVLPLEQKLYRLPRVDSAATPRSRVSGVAHGHSHTATISSSSGQGLSIACDHRIPPIFAQSVGASRHALTPAIGAI